jgi:glutamyl-tRNA synthetase
MLGYRGRFAPSPTGDLHLGGACTALCAWLAARAAGGSFIVRMEDLDLPRVVDGASARILQDLRWLGLDWDEGPDIGGPLGPYTQSARTHLYQQALGQLTAASLTYPCDCSRSEIARVASAPHPGEDGPPYPGTCRNRISPTRFRRPPAIRLAVPTGIERVQDAVHGAIEADVRKQAGDFVLRRGDGVFAYQLAVVVDDLGMRISQVVRGADLLSSTARQALLARLLGHQPPAFAHAPLIVSADGSRLAKRARAVCVRDHREAGVDPCHIVAFLGRALGLCESHEKHVQARELVTRFAWSRIPQGPVALPSDALAL